MRKCSQNDAKTMSKINDKSIKFRNLRFLVFCEEYNVKIVFSHDQGYKINAKSMQKSMKNRCSKKGCQNHEQRSKREAKWEPKRSLTSQKKQTLAPKGRLQGAIWGQYWSILKPFGTHVPPMFDDF